jgi:hypothetical protein
MTVTVLTHIDSSTLCLPELQAFIGKDVRIIVLEEPETKASRPRLKKLRELAGHIDLDFEAIQQLRDRSIM